MAIERVGHVGPENPELTFDRPRLERNGFLSILSFRLDGRLRRELMDRGDAIVVLPVERAARKLWMLRESRPLKAIAATDGGRALLRAGYAGEAGEALRLEAAAADIWELPAGMIDRGQDGSSWETPVQAAVRELAEETGLVVGPERLKPIPPYYPSVGGCLERMHPFIAELPDPVVRLATAEDDGERMDIFRMDWEDAFAMLDDGRIETASTRVLLLELQRS